MDKQASTRIDDQTAHAEASATVPVGERVLGRVLDAHGEAIDGFGPIAGAPRVPISHPAQEPPGPQVLEQMLESGIKVVDLFAPAVRGGTLRLSSLPGVGAQVLIGELIYRLASRRDGCAVWVSWEERMYRADYLMRELRELNVGNRTAMVLGRIADPPAVRDQALLAGLTLAEHFRGQGRDVLLVIDAKPPPPLGLKSLHQRLVRGDANGAMTLALVEILNDDGIADHPGIVGSSDSWLVFDVGLARNRLYPAVDPLMSGSRLLESRLVSAEHMEVARRAQELLRRHAELGVLAEEHGAEAAPPEDRQLILRARRLRRFLTQPYFTAEPWTGIPGEYVGVDDTISGVKALLEGHYDHVPEEAFSYVGAIQQTLEKAKIA